jgi:hypothetical protein
MKGLMFSITLLAASFNTYGVMIGLCPGTPPVGVIPCDSGCTGSSATNMATQVSSAEFQMVNAFNDLNRAWLGASNTDANLILLYMQKKLLTSNQRLAAFSGVEAKVSSTLSISQKETQFGFDSLLTAVESISNSKKAYETKSHTVTHQGAGDNATRIPLMLSNSAVMSDPVNSKSMQTDLLLGWEDIIQKYSKKEADILAFDTDDIILSSLSLGEDKLSLAVSSEVSKLLAFRHLYNKDNRSTEAEQRSIRDKLAIDLLLQSFDVDPLVHAGKTQIGLAQDWFVSIQEMKRISTNKPRDLSIDLTIGQGLENALLNEYLTIKKGKNIVRALN